MSLKFSNYFQILASSGLTVVVAVIFFIALGFPSSEVENFEEVESNQAEQDIGLPPSPSLTPGSRSVVIPGHVSTGFQRNVPPGARVDVLVEYRAKDRPVQKVIVQNARVLQYDEDAVILDVSPDDLLAIKAAQQRGRVFISSRAHFS